MTPGGGCHRCCHDAVVCGKGERSVNFRASTSLVRASERGTTCSSSSPSAGFSALLWPCSLGSRRRASNVIVPLDISNQSVFWVGEGVNGSGDSQISNTFGTCAPAGGGNSTCDITGNFAFGGGGTYNFQVSGPSPFQGVETTPTSGFYNLNLSNTTYEFTLNFNNGLSKTYVNINGPGAPPHQFSSWTDSFVSSDSRRPRPGHDAPGTIVAGLAFDGQSAWRDRLD